MIITSMQDHNKDRGKIGGEIMGGYTVLVIAVVAVLMASWTAGNIIHAFGETAIEWESQYEGESLGGGFSTVPVIPEYLIRNLMISILFSVILGGVIFALVDPSFGKNGRIKTSMASIFLVLLFIFLFMYLITSHGDILSFPLSGNGSPSSNTGESTPEGILGGSTGVMIPLILFTVLGIFVISKYLRYILHHYSTGKDTVDYGINTTLDRTMRDLRSGEDVRSTIIRCYQKMCYNLQDKGIKQEDYITPREFRKIAISRLPVTDRTVGALTSLFEEARYSTHALGEAHKKRALTTLERLKGELSK